MAGIDDRWGAHRAELEAAASTAGVDVGVMVKIAGFESGFNLNARPIAVTHPENNTAAPTSTYALGDETARKALHLPEAVNTCTRQDAGRPPDPGSQIRSGTWDLHQLFLESIGSKAYVRSSKRTQY